MRSPNQTWLKKTKRIPPIKKTDKRTNHGYTRYSIYAKNR